MIQAATEGNHRELGRIRSDLTAEITRVGKNCEERFDEVEDRTTNLTRIAISLGVLLLGSAVTLLLGGLPGAS